MLNENVAPKLQALFERQPCGVFRPLWWFQDGTPAHRLITVHDGLRELFANRVIAFVHAVEWPSRSPDLTPCDFSFGAT